MIKFDLTKALAGAEVVYRNGEVPLEWHYFEKKRSIYKLCTINPKGDKCFHKDNGEKFSCTITSDYDLFLKEPEMFVNVYPNGEFGSNKPFTDLNIARSFGVKTYRLVEVTDK